MHELQNLVIVSSFKVQESKATAQVKVRRNEGALIMETVYG